MKKRCISLLLAMILVFSLAPVFNVHVRALSSGQNNIVARAYQQVQIKWTPVKDVKGYINSKGTLTKTFYAGTTYSGIPYGQVPSVGKYVPNDVSFDTFLSAVANQDSLFYSTRGKNSSNGVSSTYYASDCSAFVSYAYDIGRMTTTGIASSSLFSKVSGGIENAQVGDCYNDPGNHVVLITGLTYDSNGNLSKVEISEQTPPIAKTSTYSVSQIESKYSGYTLLRYKNRDSVPAPIPYSGEKPSTPEITSANSKSTSSIEVKWGAVNGATSYRLDRRLKGTDTYSTVAENIKGTSYVDTGLTAGTMYWYRVYAVNSAGTSAGSGKFNGWTKCDPPTITSVAATGTNQVVLSWSAVTGAKSYAITRRMVDDDAYETVATGLTSRTFTDTNLSPDTKYYYHLFAVNEDGYWSEHSVAKSVVTLGNVANAVITLPSSSYQYTGSALTPTPTVKQNNVTLTQGSDYTLAYQNNVNAGTAAVVVTGKNQYHGTKSATFTISPRSMTDSSVSAALSLENNRADYTGAEVRPKATVSFSADGSAARTLVEGTDYTLEYSNNVNPGTATVVVRGIGNFTGSKELTFQIVKSEASPFSDVPAGKFYTDAVLWAVSQNPQITNGYADGTFRPDQTCTRAQVVTFLWRANGSPEPKLAVNPFKDVSASAYYYKAVLWALENGITTGYSDGTFRPNDECTRAHVVTFLWRSEGSPETESMVNPFTDVPAGSYYTKAVLWALENGITTGKTTTTFNPDGACTRAHVVTFLYRDMA